MLNFKNSARLVVTAGLCASLLMAGAPIVALADEPPAAPDIAAAGSPCPASSDALPQVADASASVSEAPAANEDADGYVLWDGTGDFPTAGKVRLVGDVVNVNLNHGNANPAPAASVAGSLTLDLNGHTLENFYRSPSGRRIDGPIFSIESGGQLTIEDPKGGGSVETSTTEASGITVKEGGSLLIKSGTVHSKKGKIAAILVNGSLTMEGGSVTEGGNIAGGTGSARGKGVVEVAGESAVFTMTGGEISQGGSYGAGALYLGDGARAVISGGTIELTTESAKSDFGAVCVRDGCTAEITGDAKVISVSQDYGALVVYGGGKAVISGNALIQNDGKRAAAVDAYAASGKEEGAYVEVKGGTIRNTQIKGAAVRVNDYSGAVKGATLVFSGGLIENTNAESGRAIDLAGNVVMSGGTVKQVGPDPAFTLIDGVSINIEGKLTITGGEVFASSDIDTAIEQILNWRGNEVTGGVFSHPVTEFIADDGTEVAVSKNGVTVYAVGGSIASAVGDAGEGDTVTVLKGTSVTGVPDGVTVKNGTDAPITVNGVTVPAGETVEAHVHGDVKHVEAKPATCTEDGVVEHWACSECGRLFEDEELTKEIAPEDVVVKATGHDVAAAIHHEGKAATVEAEGVVEHWECPACHALFLDAGLTKPATAEQVVLPKLDPEPEKVDKGALSQLIGDAKQVSTGGKSDKVVAEYKAALAKAIAVFEDKDATQDEVDAALARLNAALTALDADKGNQGEGDKPGPKPEPKPEEKPNEGDAADKGDKLVQTGDPSAFAGMVAAAGTAVAAYGVARRKR